MSLTTDLVSFWSLEEASGTRNDDHGTNHLTDNGAVGNVAGVVGNAATFTKSNSTSLSIADNASLSLGSDSAFYIALWVRHTTITGGDVFVSKGVITGTGDEYLLWVGFNGSENTPQFYVGNGSSNANVFSTIVGYDISTTYFIEALHDPTANQIELWINRGNAGTTAWSGGTQNTTETFRLGSTSAGGNYLDGWMDQVYFRKGSIPTTGERDALYNGGAGASYASFAGGGGGSVASQLLTLGVG